MTILDLVWVLVQVVCLILLADFTGGLFHWAEDTWGDETTPFWGPHFVRPNIGHHDRPSAILSVPWLRAARYVLAAGAAMLLAGWVLGWQLWLYVALAAFNDQAHRLEHTPTVRLPAWARLLQRAGILQDARHHWQHHRLPHTAAYCVLTPWLNPILDRTGFWRGLEREMAPVLGTPRGRDLGRAAEKG